MTIQSTNSIPIQKTALQVCAYLQQEGYKAEVDNEGDIVFRCEGLAYLLCLDPHDVQWGRLMVPFVWEFEPATEGQDVMTAIDYVNRRSKLVKAYTTHRRVHLCVQVLLDPPECWTAVVIRCIRALAEARSLLVNAIRVPELVALDKEAVASQTLDTNQEENPMLRDISLPSQH